MYFKLIVMGLITVVILILPLVFAAFDFWAGIRKAKQRGERITSDGWKRSVSKLNRYYNFVLVMLPIDMIHILCFWYLDTFYDYNIPIFPILTTVAVLVVGAIEVKSIYEKADEKDRKDISDIASLAHVVAQNKDNIPEIVSQVLLQLNESEKNK